MILYIIVSLIDTAIILLYALAILVGVYFALMIALFCLGCLPYAIGLMVFWILFGKCLK